MYEIFDRLVRDDDHPFRSGDRIEMTSFTIEVLRVTSAGAPLEVAFRFKTPLEDSSLVWLGWEDWRYVPFALPAVGETLHLAADTGGF